jgi:hypothetical protein
MRVLKSRSGIVNTYTAYFLMLVLTEERPHAFIGIGSGPCGWQDKTGKTISYANVPMTRCPDPDAWKAF